MENQPCPFTISLAEAMNRPNRREKGAASSRLRKWVQNDVPGGGRDPWPVGEAVRQGKRGILRCRKRGAGFGRNREKRFWARAGGLRRGENRMRVASAPDGSGRKGTQQKKALAQGWKRCWSLALAASRVKTKGWGRQTTVK